MTKKIEKNRKKIVVKVLGLMILIVFSFSIIGESFFAIENVGASTAGNESDGDDYELYQKYKLYKKYDRRKKYRKYKKYKEKYAFENKEERMYYRDRYNKYKLYKKNKATYWRYAGYWDDYKRYRNYKNKYKPYRKYKKYKKYNKSKYNKSRYKKYGKDKYKKGYKRYKRSKNSAVNLGGGSYGPEIKVGLWSYSRDDLRNGYFKIKANKDYVIKNEHGSVVGTIAAGTITRVGYISDGNLKVYNSIAETNVGDEVFFEPADGNVDNMIFDAYQPSSSYDQYRGKMKLRYAKKNKSIWVINTVKLEQYTWGMGEITGTGDMDYNRIMAVSYRTYGYWKIKYSTKYANYGFEVTDESSSQIYRGYDWETGHSRIRDGAEDTRGTIVMYGSRIAITPYSSWTDGRTRSFEERWGSDNYPWCKSVNDSYGKHPSKGTSQLVAEGNHMVGLSAHGALSLAGEHGWSWSKILNHYFSGITLTTAY